MGQGEKKAVSIQAIQRYSLVRQYCPGGINAGLLNLQLRDPALLYQDLDALCEMDESALRALVQPAGVDVVEEDLAQTEASSQSEEEMIPRTPDECVQITVDPSGLLARMKLIEPPEEVAEPGRREMLRALFQKKITSGVKTEFIARLAERPLYDRFFRIAECKPAENGKDGVVEFHFDPSMDLRPRMSEDGTADYRALDFVKSVKAGDLLCQIVPPTQGVDGIDVYGRPIPAVSGRTPEIRCGANTALFDDGLQIRALCDGQVFLRGDTVTVSQFLNLDAVDFSTGNIDFPGSVHIRGDVANGFTVKAGGDIVVSGVVENATLIAGGSIALCSGIKGGGNGFLDAGQDIRTLFIESCRARAGGSIYADSILNSFLECGGQVSVFGKRGYLLGGTCVAGELISAVQIGNQANIPTKITVGACANLSEQKRQSLAAADRYHDTVDRLSALAAEDARTLHPSAAFCQELARISILILRLESEADQLQCAAGQPTRPRRRVVQVLEALHPNVSLEIDGVAAKNTSLRARCTIAQRNEKLYFTK